jgi:RNA 3'-terminal phosphate cyclase-like protein
MMVLCPEDVSKIRMGKLTQQTIQLLRLLREVFGSTFKMRTDAETGTLILSCLGSGFKNYAKGIA